MNATARKRERRRTAIAPSPAVLLAAALVGCGGGGESEPVAADELGGTVLIEQRRGKTTIEAWFSPLVDAAPAVTPSDWRDGTERCSFSARTASAPSAVGDAPPPLTLDAGPALTLSSRGGEHARLDAQRLGDTQVYATPDRWLETPLPDDLMLAVPGGPGFAASGGVPVPIVPAPVLLEPSDGTLASLADTVRWEAATPGESRMRLSLSFARVVDGDAHAALTVIDCELDDDGAFTVPDTLAERLPDAPGGIAVALVRERTVRHALGESSVSLRSLAHP